MWARPPHEQLVLFKFVCQVIELKLDERRDAVREDLQVAADHVLRRLG
jgi:hypothetical protein